jgi:dihydropteroate synthase
MTPTLIGILNLTPDSFSDGERVADVAQAVEQAESLVQNGAGVVDVGAESTRPRGTPLSPAEEWARLRETLPAVLAAIHARGALVSLDTRHAETAARAVALGVDWINDVTGFTDPAMVAAVRHTHTKLVVMHSLGVPVDPTLTLPPDCDPIAETSHWLLQQAARLESHGIARERIILDPGLGFGKNAYQTLAMVRGVRRFCDLGYPLLMGHSRKSFLGLFTDQTAESRDPETYGVSAWLAMQGVDYLRVHEVSTHARILRALGVCGRPHALPDNEDKT